MDKKKVISFKTAKEGMKKRIKEEDINSLFVGLLKIAKKWAISEVEREIKEECEEAKGNFAMTLKELHDTQIRLKREQVTSYKYLEKIELQQKQICALLSKLSELSLNSKMNN